MKTIVALLIGPLLHLANADPPITRRRDFYALKTRLLERFGRREDGIDIQHIRKPCWDCHGQQTWWAGEDRCGRCGGSGVYARFWVTLARWRLGRYRFHIPLARFSTMPRVQPVAVIQGYIEHRPYPFRLSREAFFWLVLLCDQQLFRSSFGTWGALGPWWTRWTPMVALSSWWFHRRHRHLLNEEIPF